MKIDLILGPKNRPMTRYEAAGLIAAIARRTRRHPAIKRGVSVRGSIAFDQVVQGFGAIENGLSLKSIEKAALITLPPRIELYHDVEESPETIIKNIVKDILNGQEDDDEPAADDKRPKKRKKLSFDEFMAALQDKNLSAALEKADSLDPDDRGNFSVIPGGEQADSDAKMERDDRFTDTLSWMPPLEDSLKEMLGELEQKLLKGEISESDFRYQQKKLQDMLDAARYLDSDITDDEIAETLMEFMDAGDKQWQKETDFRDMYVYYHINAAQKTGEITETKKNWYGLKVIIDYLQKQDLLESNRQGTGFKLTEKALDTVVRHVLSAAKSGKENPKRKSYRLKKNATERRQDTRRFASGDVFRDISMRRTIREIARKRRTNSEISRHDIRIFLKEQRDRKSDIVLCLDSSGSMGFHGKLTLAKLTAAAMARDALRNGNRVGVVTFDDLGKSVLSPTDRSSEVMRYLTGVASGGNTNIGDGLKCARTVLTGDRSRNRKVIMLVTDGEPTAISEEALATLEQDEKKDMTGEYALREAKRAWSGGIETSVIHITSDGQNGKTLVSDIAKVGHGEVRRIGRPEDTKTAIL